MTTVPPVPTPQAGAIIVAGNPQDGWIFYGPFADEQAATEYTATTDHLLKIPSEWWISVLWTPPE